MFVEYACGFMVVQVRWSRCEQDALVNVSRHSLRKGMTVKANVSASVNCQSSFINDGACGARE